MMGRASRALDIAFPENPVAVASRFNDITQPRCSQLQVLLLPDFKDLVCRQFETLAALHRWSIACRKSSSMHERAGHHHK